MQKINNPSYYYAEKVNFKSTESFDYHDRIHTSSKSLENVSHFFWFQKSTDE